MRCMKCGRDIEPSQVFCPECLEEMKKYPVNPNATVRLPRRTDPLQFRRTARRKPSAEAEIGALKKKVKLLRFLLAIAIALIIALSVPAIRLAVQDSISVLPGQNYSSAEQSPVSDG